MKKTALLLATITVASFSQANEDIATTNNCLACHKTDTQLVGPSYQDVAAKYKDQKGAADMLIESIKVGSSGKWGAIPMPANAQVSDKDIKALAEWILAM